MLNDDIEEKPRECIVWKLGILNIVFFLSCLVVAWIKIHVWVTFKFAFDVFLLLIF